MYKLFLFFLSLSFTIGCMAQTEIKIDKNTVAIDSAGGKHKAKTWGQLRKKGYGVKPEDINDPNTRFGVYKLSDAEKKSDLRRVEMEKGRVKEGDPFQPFAAKDINGKEINLADTTGKVIVLNFWFVNCGPCRKEIPELNELVEEYKNDDRVQFYAVALDKKEQLEAFLKKSPFNYQMIPDGANICRSYGLSSFPTNMVIDTKGKINFVAFGYGFGSISKLKKAIHKAL
jgi:peroxiredoxin